MLDVKEVLKSSFTDLIFQRNEDASKKCIDIIQQKTQEIINNMKLNAENKE